MHCILGSSAMNSKGQSLSQHTYHLPEIYKGSNLPLCEGDSPDLPVFLLLSHTELYHRRTHLPKRKK